MICALRIHLAALARKSSSSGFLTRIPRYLVGAVLLVAGVLKLVDPTSFVEAVETLRGIPSWIAPVVIAVIPFLEILLGAMAIAGKRNAIVGSTILNFLFLALIVVNLFAGNAGMDCGCFANVVPSTIGVASLVRQTTIVVLGSYASLREKK